ncbi:MAG: hypothetical protein ACFFE5_03425 [Candidatus Thorarchaeota archaeon]
MKKKTIIYFAIIANLLTMAVFIFPAKAHNPSGMSLNYNFAKQELNVSITHNVANPNNHFIISVVIRVNGSIAKDEIYTSQPTTSTFKYQYNITARHGATIQATANCNIGGTISRNLIVIDPTAKPSNFLLSTNAGNPDNNGIFDLIWTNSAGVDNYSVYSHTSLITEINQSVNIIADQNASSPLLLSGFSNGSYYFLVRAFNENGERDSNVEKVTVLISAGNGVPPGIPGYSIILILSSVLITLILLSRKKNIKS